MNLHHLTDVPKARAQNLVLRLDERHIIDHLVRPSPPLRRRLALTLIHAGQRLLDEPAEMAA